MRYCGECRLHVRNLSALSRREISQVIAESRAGRVCIAYACDADGNFLTRFDRMARRWFRPFRIGFAWIMTAIFSMAFGACATKTTATTASSAACEKQPGPLEPRDTTHRVAAAAAKPEYGSRRGWGLSDHQIADPDDTTERIVVGGGDFSYGSGDKWGTGY